MASLTPRYCGHVGRASPLLNKRQSVNEVRYLGQKSLLDEPPGPRTATGGHNSRELGERQAAALGEDDAVQRATDRTCEAGPAGHDHHGGGSAPQSSSVQQLHHEEDYLELFMLADRELGSEKSADYGFIFGVVCLVTGISLVAVSYAVPRDVSVDPDSVSAREMERLERENARVGARLDGCVIAGLSLLTLGGAVLATLLMVSMWRWEAMRRKAFAYSKHAAKLYGSINPGAGPTPPPHREAPRRLSADLEALS
ncbi:hypothetical protein NHX12_023465 [Muraenolepis orangiensis]|uniref:Transmembrane protein 74 n=1 Tax=Muraenolepis orangiensis TaxID=630683 RepID=A0A9Q0IQ12_9TELE|nr:hypothetical protein NHX12_023465 [Muraenolepis orangiensis]